MRRGVSMPKMLNVQIPPYFRCPISLDLMRDPVILSTGQTYDRASIEKWVADGNTTCPATMQQLKDFTLIPNHTLRRLIQDWCVANRSKGVERIPTPKQPADPQRVEALLLDSSSSNPNRASQFFALKVLRGLAKESDKNRLLIAEKGAFETLVTAFFNGNFPTEREEKTGIPDPDPPKCDQELIEEALGVLVLLHMNELNGAAISKPNQLAMVSWLLNKGSMEGRINAASLVEKLSSLNEELKNSLGTTGGIIEGLVKLMKEPMYPRSVKIGVKALFSLCLSTSSKIGEKAVAAGAPEALVEHLPEAQKGDAERTLATLELLCKTVSGRAAVGSHALAIPALSKMVLRVSDQATECAAGTLYSICTASNCAQRAAVQAGVFTQMLLVIQSDCTVRAKRKAMDLLKLLKSCWTEDPCVSEFGRTNIVAF